MTAINATTRALKLLQMPRLNTPILLRVAVPLLVLPIAFFAIVVHVGVTRNDNTVQTVGRDATKGITAAQQIKLNLAELDTIVARDLVLATPRGASGFPDDYNAKRNELDFHLVEAAGGSPSGAAYQQPLANIAYALGHYHALVKESFAALRTNDSTTAADLYRAAHDVAANTLLPQADSLDKANTYLLNTTYDGHKSDSNATSGLLVVAWIVLLATFGLVQVWLVVKFRRMLNAAIAAATVLAIISGTFALARLSSSKNDLAIARERAFDSVHELARARATLVAAEQAHAQLLLDPSAASTSDQDFAEQTRRIFRIPDMAKVAETAHSGQVPSGAGGYLATVNLANVSSEGNDAAKGALAAFGQYLLSDQDLRRTIAAGDTPPAKAILTSDAAFTLASNEIDRAQAVNQATFDRSARDAEDATAHVDQFNVLAAVGMVLLSAVGLYQRRREYGD